MDETAHPALRPARPARLRNDARELCGYLVIPDDEPHAELWNLADELAERRARKRAGISPIEPSEGRIVNRLLHPLDISE
jgi:hypothetical protein